MPFLRDHFSRGVEEAKDNTTTKQTVTSMSLTMDQMDELDEKQIDERLEKLDALMRADGEFDRFGQKLDGGMSRAHSAKRGLH